MSQNYLCGVFVEANEDKKCGKLAHFIFKNAAGVMYVCMDHKAYYARPKYNPCTFEPINPKHKAIM